MPFSPAIGSLLLAIIVAFLVTFITAPPVIAYLRRNKLGQTIREDGPQTHLGKAGTPTMGGVTIIAGMLFGTLCSWLLFPHAIVPSALLLALTLSFMLIGAIDDWNKIFHGRNLGLRAREKLLLQFIFSGLFVAALLIWAKNATTIGIPGVGEIEIGWYYWPLAILFITGMSNALNLTDGLDGLAAGTTFWAASALAVISWLSGGDHTIGTAIATLAASCLAFLWYNRRPAQMFMGDTGSLALGAALAGTALILKQEIILLVIGFIFLIELFSVIIQVISFQTTGKRVFLMSPYHHHLEKLHWDEQLIVTRAWILAALLAIIACLLVYYLH